MAAIDDELLASLQAGFDDHIFELQVAAQGPSYTNELKSAGYNFAGRLASIPAALGSETAADARDSLEHKGAVYGQNSNLVQSWDDVNGVGDVISYTGHLLTQSAPDIALAATGAGAASAATRAAVTAGRMALPTAAGMGAIRTAGAVTATVPSSTGSVLQAQYDQAGEYDLTSAVPLGVAHAAVSALAGPEAFIARGIPQAASRTALGRMGTGALKTAAGEATEEVIQQGLEEVGRTQVDETHDILGETAMARYKEAAIGGALAGGAIGGAVGAVSPRPAIANVAPTQDATQIAPAPVAPQAVEPVQQALPLDMPAAPAPAVEVAATATSPTAPDETEQLSLLDDARPSSMATAGYTRESIAERLRKDNTYSEYDATKKDYVDLPYNEDWVHVEKGAAKKGGSKKDADGKSSVKSENFADSIYNALNSGGITGMREEIAKWEKRVEQIPLPDTKKPTRTARDPKYGLIRAATKLADEIERDKNKGIEIERAAAERRRMSDKSYTKGDYFVGDTPEKLTLASPEEVVKEIFGKASPNELDNDVSDESLRKWKRERDTARLVKPAAELAKFDEETKAGTAAREATRAPKLFETKLYNAVVRDIYKDGPAKTRALLDTMMEDNAGSKLPVPTLERREAQLNRAYKVLEEYELKLDAMKPAEEKATEAKKVETEEKPAEEKPASAEPTFEDMLADANARIENSFKEASKKRRLKILDGIIQDPDTRNAYARFKAALRKEGLDSILTKEEFDLVEKHEELKSTFVEEGSPNEEDNFGIPDRDAPRPKPKPLQRKKLNPPKPPVAEEVETEADEAAETPAEQAAEPVEAPNTKLMEYKSERAQLRKEIEQNLQRRKTSMRATKKLERSSKDETAQMERLLATSDAEDLAEFDRETQRELRRLETGRAAPVRTETKEASQEVQAPAEKPAAETKAEKPVTPPVKRDGRDLIAERDRMLGKIDDAESQGFIDAAKAWELREKLQTPGSDITADDIREVSRELGRARPKFRKPDAPDVPGAASVEEVEAMIAPVVAKWKGAPKVIVKTSAEATELGADNDTLGYYADGKVVILADNIKPSQVLPVLYHEALGHYGLAKAFGADLRNLMTQIYKTTPKIKRLADAYTLKYPRTDMDMSDPSVDPLELERSLAVEEVLVKGLEAGDIEMSIVDRIRGMVMRFARRMGLYSGAFSDAELGTILRQAKRAVEKGAPTPPPKPGVKQFARKDQIKAPIGKPSATVMETKQVFDTINQLPLPEDLKGAIGRGIVNLKEVARNAQYGMSFSRDLVSQIKGLIPSAKIYYDIMNKKATTVARTEERISQIMVDSEALPSAVRTEVNKFLKVSTTQQVWGYQPTWKDKAVEINPDMAQEWAKLSPEAQKVVDSVFKEGFTSRTELRAAIKALIQDDINVELARKDLSATEIRNLERQRARKLKFLDMKLPDLQGPYAPLGRFGKFVAVGKSEEFMGVERAAELEASADLSDAQLAELDALHKRWGDKARERLGELRSKDEHYAVFFEETAGAAAERALELAGEYHHSDSYAREVEHKSINEVPWLAMQRFRTMLADELDDEKKDRKKREMLRHVESLLRDMYIESLAESSARKHELRRANVKGANDDMLRSFATRGRSHARYLAAIENSGQVTDAFIKMRKEVRNHEDKNAARAALNEVLMRHAQGMDITEPSEFTNKVLSLSSLYHLLMTPRYYILNSTQPFMVTTPVLAGEFGMTKTLSTFKTAYDDVFKAIGPDIMAFLGGKFEVSQLAKLPEDERKVLSHLRENALLDIGLSYELGQWSAGDSNVSKAFGTAMHKLRTLSRQIELVNRVTSGLAAYRLNKEKHPTRTFAEHQEAATKIIANTHGDYSYANAPRFFNMLPAIVTQFRKYQMVQISLLTKLVHTSFSDNAFDESTSKEERKIQRAIARKSLAWLLGQHALVTGAKGLPLIGAAAWVMSAVLGDDDEPADAETFMRDIVGNDAVGDLLLNGVPTLLGISLTNNLGLGNVFSPLPYTDVDFTSREGFGQTLIGAMGPAVGLGMNIAQGLDYMKQGESWKGTELMLPGVAKTAMQAMRFKSEGVTRANGDTLLSAEEISYMETALKALGFQPNEIQEMYKKQEQLKLYTDYFAANTKKLKLQYTKAAKSNDAATMADVRKQWQELQDAKRRNGFKPQPLSDLVRAPAEQRKRERNTIDGIQYTKSNQGFVKELTE